MCSPTRTNSIFPAIPIPTSGSVAAADTCASATNWPSRCCARCGVNCSPGFRTSALRANPSFWVRTSSAASKHWTPRTHRSVELVSRSPCSPRTVGRVPDEHRREPAPLLDRERRPGRLLALQHGGGRAVPGQDLDADVVRAGVAVRSQLRRYGLLVTRGDQLVDQ